jgi:hypothetical protein
MNFTQSENKHVQTSCKDCLFATYENNTQAGCQFGRTEKFTDIIPAFDNDKEFFVIPRLCNYYRDEKWNNGFASLSLAKKESAVTIDILFNFNKIDDAFLNRIKSFIDYNIWGNNNYITEETLYDQNKINYAIYHNTIPQEDRQRISQFYLSHTNMSLTVNKVDDNLFIHEKLMQSNKTYHMIIDQESKFDNDIVIKLNNLINEDLSKALLVKHQNVWIISNLAYKINFYQNQPSDILYNTNKQKVIDSIVKTDLYFEI